MGIPVAPSRVHERVHFGMAILAALAGCYLAWTASHHSVGLLYILGPCAIMLIGSAVSAGLGLRDREKRRFRQRELDDFHRLVDEAASTAF
jgi:hypothetical protein